MQPDSIAAPALGPTAGQERISTLDSLRGFALLGILLLNIVGFGLPLAYDNPENSGGADGWNGIAWMINTLLFEGTMRGLFSVLFGAGVILLTSRAEARGGGVEIADIYYRRTLWLIAFGLVHAWLLLWVGDILYIYGVAGLVLFVFRHMAARKLILLGVAIMLLSGVQFAFEYFADVDVYQQATAAQRVLDETGSVSEEQQQAIDKWAEYNEPLTEKIQELTEEYQGGYWSHVAYNAEELIKRQSVRMYTLNLWDALSFMLIGMGLLKLGVLSGERSNGFYWRLLLVGYIAGLTINGFEMNHSLSHDPWIPVGDIQYFTYDIGRLFTMLGHLSVVVLLCKNGRLAGLMRRMAAVGRMALTNYVMHTVICIFIFYGFGLGLYAELERHQLYYIVFAIWVLQLIVSPIWLQQFRFGPLEWLWRSLTYQKKQPFRR